MRHALLGGLMGVMLLGGWGHALAQSWRPAIAVTDLAYAEEVAEYFNVGQYHSKSQSRSNAKQHPAPATPWGAGGCRLRRPISTKRLRRPVVSTRKVFTAISTKKSCRATRMTSRALF